MKCRFCKSTLDVDFLDLGTAPPSNAYLTADQMNQPESYFPLHILTCDQCWLVQTRDFNAADELFDENYAYFSSVSKSWLQHAKDYCAMITDRLDLGADSFAVELASNDGYLLKNFVENGVPCLGIEPTKSTADAAEKIGVPVLREFFGEECAAKLIKDKKADLIIANNVYAHVPDIRDFTKGIRVLLADNGTVTIEFPHLLKLIKFNQFDTVYHEHYSYLSLSAVKTIFEACDLKIYDVEEITTHGGSLRIYGTPSKASYEISENVTRVLAEEKEFGLLDAQTYTAFQKKAEAVKDEFWRFLIQAKADGKTVVGYGAAAKGNTLLNFSGVKQDMIKFVCDAAESKQGKYLPGSRIEVVAPDRIKEEKPDYVVIFPWNIKDEIIKQLDYIREWGGKFVTFVPSTEIV